MRRLLTAVFLVALLGVAAPAASQEESAEQPPTELWEEYPLETAPSAPPEGGEKPPARDESPPPAAEPRPGASEDDGGLGTFAILAMALLAVAASAAVVRLGIAARRRRTTPAIGPNRRERPAHRPRPVPAVAGAPPTRPQRRPANVRDRRRSAPAAPDWDAVAPEPPTPKRRRAAPASARPTLAKPPAPDPTTEGPLPTALPQPEPAVTAAASAAAAGGASPPEAPMNGRESEEGEPSGPARPATFERTEAASSKARVPSPAPGAAPPQPGANVAPGEERALGYTTVARPEDAETQLRLEARQIQAACKKRGLPLHKLVRDVESHSSADLSRPGLSYALERLATGEFTCLVVTSLDRLTRSAASLGTLIYLLEERRTRLIVIDIGLDTRTDEGRLAARALVKVSGVERRKLEEHARKGLGAARDKRRSSGRPAVADRPSLKRRIAEMRAGGMTLQAIADTLNEEGVPTLRGGARWRPSSVQGAAGYKRPSRKAGPEPRNGPGDGSPP